MSPEKRLQHIELSLGDLRSQLRQHALYDNLKTVDDVRKFTECHVFAVWDFMSLLKSLQVNLTNTQVPWTPATSPALTRFVNEIVHEEESDVNELDQPMSHFEMYLQAMQQLGADTHEIKAFIQMIQSGKSVNNSLSRCRVPDEVIEFVKATFSIIETGKPHIIASAFTFGREDLIPDMFIAIMERAATDGDHYTKFTYYLKRHIELDGDDHGPLALQMIATLCGDDDQKWIETLEIAKYALKMRIQLWNGVNRLLLGKQPLVLA